MIEWVEHFPTLVHCKLNWASHNRRTTILARPFPHLTRIHGPDWLVAAFRGVHGESRSRLNSESELKFSIHDFSPRIELILC